MFIYMDPRPITLTHTRTHTHTRACRWRRHGGGTHHPADTGRSGRHRAFGGLGL